MLLYEINKGGSVSGKLITYPAGSCFVLADSVSEQKIILRMDDAGFGKLFKFLASKLGEEPAGEVVIHDFRVTLNDRVLRVEGSMLDKAGHKTKGEMSLPMGGHLEQLVAIMTQMNMDGYKLWSAGDKYRLNLCLSHKRGLELNVSVDGTEVGSLRLVYVPQDLIEAVEILHDGVVEVVELHNPWYQAELWLEPRAEMVEIQVSGHLAGEMHRMSIPSSYEALDDLATLVRDYFFG